MSTATPTIEFQPPIKSHLRSFNRSLAASSQVSTIPSVFLDALRIREAVFVEEQKNVPLKHHTDGYEARACNWVLYLPSSTPESSPQPVGSIRLIPYPCGPLPKPGACIVAPGEDVLSVDAESMFFAPTPKYLVKRETSLYDGKEPYIALGRMCVRKEFRGNGYAGLLVQAALKWAAENPRFSEDGLDAEERKRVPAWKGLVFIDANEAAVGMYKRRGFVIDEKMGSWSVCGMKHIGMFIRLKIEEI